MASILTSYNADGFFFKAFICVLKCAYTVIEHKCHVEHLLIYLVYYFETV